MSLERNTRRRFLKAVSTAAIMAITGDAWAQPAAAAARPKTPKGPPVWLDLDQAELDAAYNQGVWAQNLSVVVKRYEMLSDEARARLGEPQRYAFGPSPIEGLDVFRTKRPNAPIHIFIHGGAWRQGLAKG